MTPKTKSESSADVVRAVDELERRCDLCYQPLALLKRDWNLAAWLSLTEVVRRLEESISPNEYGSGKHKVAVMNLARVAEQMRKFCHHAKRALSAPSRFQWSHRAATECAAAFDVAWNYSMLCIDFPAWHANLYTAELVDQSTVRFRSGDSQISRRANAYLKGIRPLGSRAAKDSGVPPDASKQLRSLFEEALRSVRGRGLLAIKVGDVDRLRNGLRDMYDERLASLFRRYPDISLGIYTLEQFRNCYVALLTVVGAHEHLCFLWAREHRFPLDSAVLVYNLPQLVKLLCKYSGESSTIVEAIIPDLTAGVTRAQDLQTLPIVPLADHSSIVAIAPAFPLASNWEENILRVCSYSRPEVYSLTSVTKEEEMRDRLKDSARAPRMISGPFNIGKGIPDLDLILEDSEADAVVLAELKWPRRPYSPREILQRNSEIRKGIAQIKAIKSFLVANPAFLSDRGKMRKPLNEYSHIQFCVVSRDHLIPSDETGLPVYAYDVFEDRISGDMDTPSVLADLNGMNWLPTEGRDYKCEWIRSEAGGITVLTELFQLSTRGQALVTTR